MDRKKIVRPCRSVRGNGKGGRGGDEGSVGVRQGVGVRGDSRPRKREETGGGNRWWKRSWETRV